MPHQRTGVTARRLGLAEQAAQLRAKGLLQREIADRLGVSRKYASALLVDPDGAQARARKDSYRLPCPRCGEPMSGADGLSGHPGLCWRCTAARQHEERYWTPERIIESFRAFATETGRTPTTGDAGPGLSPSIRVNLSDERVAEIEAAPQLPHPKTVTTEFGGWRAAVLAAGLEPAPRGAPARRNPYPSARDTVLLAQLAAGARTSAEIAAERGVTQRSVANQLKRLVNDGAVRRKRSGTTVVYRLADASREEVAAMEPRWVVLYENGDGTLRVIGKSDAPTIELAVERLAVEAGTYRCVRFRDWKPLELKPTTRLMVVREPPVAAGKRSGQ